MTDDTVVTAPKTVRPLKGAEYMLLELEDGGHWNERGLVTGRDAAHAIRKQAEALNVDESTFVAVPAKSWKPLTVRAETVTTLKLEEVKA
jgi:hypothetical protein